MSPERDAPLPRIDGLDLVGLLGRGATSMVYLGVQQQVDRMVAVKVLGAMGRGELSAELFGTEIRMLALLSSHPNVLTLYDTGTTDDGRPYLVTEYMPAGTLADRVQRSGPLPWQEVLEIGVQLAGALETAHIHGVAHGDVTMKNVMVGRTGQPLLGDFGIAALMSPSETVSRAALTPLHSAPELLEGAPPSAASDLYGLASSLQALLVGSSPVGRGDGTSVRGLAGPKRGVRTPVAASVAPAPMREVIAAGTAPDPADRPASAAEFGEALRAVQRSEGVSPTTMPIMSEVDEPRAAGFVDLRALRIEEADQSAAPGASTRTWHPPLRRLGLVVLVAAALVSAITIITLDPGGKQAAPDVADADASLTSGPPGPTVMGATTSSTVALPESRLAGVQPDIDYRVGELADTSAALEEALAEESAIFDALDGAAVASVPFYGPLFTSLPAQFHYQGFNPDHGGISCRGMMTREITVTGLWERTAIWPGGVLRVTVGETADAAMARELSTAISLNIGVDPTACRGMADFNVADYDDFGVDRRDMAGLVSESVDHNHWSERDVVVGDRTWGYSTRLIIWEGPYAIDIGVLADAPLPIGNDEAAGRVASQIVARLMASE